MANVSAETTDGGRATRVGGEAAAARRRWFRVRVATDEGSYLGQVRLEKGRSALRELIDDDRTYLSVWNARHEGTGDMVEFLAIHKAAIRYVVVDGEEPHSPSQAA
jgi:hypothetical protein